MSKHGKSISALAVRVIAGALVLSVVVFIAIQSVGKANYTATATSPDGSAKTAIVTLSIGDELVVNSLIVHLPWSATHPADKTNPRIAFDVQPVTGQAGTLSCRVERLDGGKRKLEGPPVSGAAPRCRA